jgi:phosphate uptake regulator
VVISVEVDGPVRRLFSLVSQALEGATMVLLDQDRKRGQSLVDGDRVIDGLTSQVEQSIWETIRRDSPDPDTLRRR